jgi:hypothetical protein
MLVLKNRHGKNRHKMFHRNMGLSKSGKLEHFIKKTFFHFTLKWPIFLHDDVANLVLLTTNYWGLFLAL